VPLLPINLDGLIDKIKQRDRLDMDYTRLFIPWNWWILWLDAYLPPIDEPDAVSREAHSGKGMTSEPPLSSPGASQRL
jgi:hypothetical protein